MIHYKKKRKRKGQLGIRIFVYLFTCAERYDGDLPHGQPVENTTRNQKLNKHDVRRPHCLPIAKSRLQPRFLISFNTYLSAQSPTKASHSSPRITRRLLRLIIKLKKKKENMSEFSGTVHRVGKFSTLLPEQKISTLLVKLTTERTRPILSRSL